MTHRAVRQKVEGSQTTVYKSRSGNISFIVKVLHESILVFAEKIAFHKNVTQFNIILHINRILFNTIQITKMAD
jgi:hypothetical protein